MTQSRCLLKFCTETVSYPAQLPQLPEPCSFHHTNRTRLKIESTCWYIISLGKELVLVRDLRNTFFDSNYEMRDWKLFWSLGFIAPLLFRELAFTIGWHGREQLLRNTPSPIRVPGRQSCLYIVSLGESFTARAQPPLVHENPFKTILSPLHKTSGVTIDIPNKTAICQTLRVREQRTVSMCQQKSFW